MVQGHAGPSHLDQCRGVERNIGMQLELIACVWGSDYALGPHVGVVKVCWVRCCATPDGSDVRLILVCGAYENEHEDFRFDNE